MRNFLTINKRGLIVLLLGISCICAAYLLYVLNPVEVHQLENPQQLDSLITESFRSFNLDMNRIQTQNIEIDRSFTRKQLLVDVPATFSKTTFHYQLHERLLPYKAETIGRVEFPDQNLRVHIVYNETIHRTIYLRSDPNN